VKKRRNEKQYGDLISESENLFEIELLHLLVGSRGLILKRLVVLFASYVNHFKGSNESARKHNEVWISVLDC
jgi:hypothetical protein